MQKKSTSQKTTTRTTREQVVEKNLSRAELVRALASGAARVTPSEEKAVRMIHGIGAPRTLVLERIGQDNPETRARLLDIELELLRQSRARALATPVATVATAPANPKRARIVAALKSSKH